jgi:hypothetical protein
MRFGFKIDSLVIQFLRSDAAISKVFDDLKADAIQAGIRERPRIGL